MPFYVYIMANRAGTLYVGATNDLGRRVAEHRAGTGSQFVARYRLHELVCCEEWPTASEAIAREKALKGWRRDRKVALIEGMNPGWADLSWNP